MLHLTLLEPFSNLLACPIVLNQNAWNQISHDMSRKYFNTAKRLTLSKTHLVVTVSAQVISFKLLLKGLGDHHTDTFHFPLGNFGKKESKLNVYAMRLFQRRTQLIP